MEKRLVALGVLCALLPALVLPARAAEVPAVSAASAVLMDAESGRVLYAHQAEVPRAIASTTKLMTALVAAEYLEGDLSRQVTIRPEWTGIEGTSLYLKAGETITLKTLFYGLLLHSGNDAAVALAGICGGTVETFVDWMNQRAQDLGMTHTHFSDPNGLGDEAHYASALDMAKLGAACLKNPTVAAAMATRQITLEGRQLTNHNKLLWRYEDCTGMKTGYTRQAGRTLVSSATREGQTLICVTLNDRNDWEDHQSLLDYGFSAAPRRVLAQKGTVLGRVNLTGSLLHQIPVAARETVAYPMREGEEAAIELELPQEMAAPVQKGEIAGVVRYRLNGNVVGETYLVWAGSAARDVVGQRQVRSLLELLRPKDRGNEAAHGGV